MHVDSLRYFMAVVKEKSISKAAKKAHITQSALSQMILKLEEDFGCKLLVRSNRGVSVTQMGEVVLKHANHILGSYGKMKEEITLLQRNTNKIYVNGTWSLVAYSLPCVIYRMKKKFPQHNYELKASKFEETIIEIQNDICDFGFVESPISEDTQLLSHDMGKERIVLMAPNQTNYPSKISLNELVEIEIIMCTMNTKVSRILKKILTRIDKKVDDLNVIFTVDSVSAVISSVSNGFGMAFVPYEAIKHELYEKTVKIVEIEEVNLDYDIYLISKQRENLTPNVKEAVDFLIQNGKKNFC